MAYKTMQQIVTAVQNGLYQSAGPQVQLYSEGIIMQLIQDAYESLAFGKDWWPHMIKREQRTLDGTTGQVTTAFTHITQYEDIKYVYRENSGRPLPILSLARNTIDYSNGGLAKAIEPTDDSKLFKVWPQDATGDILVIGRKRSTEAFALDETINFDDLALRYFALWSYFTDDDSMQSAAKYRKLLDDRMKELRDGAFNHPILLDSRSDVIPSEWSEYR